MPDENAPDQATLELAGLVIDELKHRDFAPGSYSHYSYYLDSSDGANVLAQVFVQLNIAQVSEQPTDPPRFNPTVRRSVG